LTDSFLGKYLAPEMLGFGDSMDGSIDSDVVSKADIFSLGITVYELVIHLQQLRLSSLN